MGVYTYDIRDICTWIIFNFHCCFGTIKSHGFERYESGAVESKTFGSHLCNHKTTIQTALARVQEKRGQSEHKFPQVSQQGSYW